ncbi:MAG: hypothetical protein R2939_03845 [Kofleriaceae bacterium]
MRTRVAAVVMGVLGPLVGPAAADPGEARQARAVHGARDVGAAREPGHVVARPPRAELQAATLAVGARAASADVAPGPRRRTMSQQIADGFTALGDELDAHLAALRLDLLGLRVDGRARAAQLRVGRLTDTVGAQLDGQIKFGHGRARVAARLAVELGGHRMTLALPAFEVVPRSEFGDRYLELRLPLLEGAF